MAPCRARHKCRARHRGRSACEAIRNMAEIAADQREQIAGLGERIAPDREMPTAVEIAGGDRIAIAEQHRGFALLGLYAGRIDAQDIGPIEEIGDAAEALRLALRAIGGAGAIEPAQLRVRRRIDLRLDLQREGPLGRDAQHEGIGRCLIDLGRQRGAVERRATQDEPIAVERERSAGQAGRIAPDREARDDARLAAVQRNIQIDRIDEKRGRAIIGETNGLRRWVAHGTSMPVTPTRGRAPSQRAMGTGNGNDMEQGRRGR